MTKILIDQNALLLVVINMYLKSARSYKLGFEVLRQCKRCLRYVLKDKRLTPVAKRDKSEI